MGIGAVVLVVMAVGLAWWGGRRSGRNALFYTMESDVQFRRQLLEKLAKLENGRFVGRE